MSDLEKLYELITELSRLPNVTNVKRSFNYKTGIFLAILLLITTFIIFAPAVLYSQRGDVLDIVGSFKILFYSSVGLFIFLLYFFKYIAGITLPGLVKKKAFWSGMYGLNAFILASVIWGSLNLYDKGESIFLLSACFLVFSLTTFEWLSFKSNNDD